MFWQKVAFEVGETRYMRFTCAAEAATEKWKWLYVNGTENKGLVSAVAKVLNSSRDETNPSTCYWDHLKK